jgi:hypothetical protein
MQPNNNTTPAPLRAPYNIRITYTLKIQSSVTKSKEDNLKVNLHDHNGISIKLLINIISRLI